MALKDLEYYEAPAPETIPASTVQTVLIDPVDLPTGKTMISGAWEILDHTLTHIELLQHGPYGSGPNGTDPPYGWYYNFKNNGTSDGRVALHGLIADY